MNKHESSYLQHVLKNYLTFPNEKIVFAKRQSVFTLVPGMLILGILSLLIFIVAYIILYVFLETHYLFFVTIAVVLLTAFFLGLKIIVEWYYHLFIVTNKKLLEVQYIPLSSYAIDDVLLDQVKCTEIDLRMRGFLYEYLDVGDVAITFDRPTHKDEFVLSKIGYAREITALLTNRLSRYVSYRAGNNNLMWYKNNNSDKQYTMLDLSPGVDAGIDGDSGVDFSPG